MINFEMLDQRMSPDDLGLLPLMLNVNDPRTAKEQLDVNYSHGGGWTPFNGFELRGDNSIKYPGDKPLKPLAQAHLRNELVVYYPHAWVAIIQPDRSFEICRMD